MDLAGSCVELAVGIQAEEVGPDLGQHLGTFTCGENS